MNHPTTLQNVAYCLIIFVIVGWLLYIGADILMPIAFGTLFAIFLYPIAKKINKIVKIPILSIVLSFLVVIVPITAVGVLFSIQFMDIIDSLPSIGSNLKVGMNKTIAYVNNLVPFLEIDSEKLLSENMKSIVAGPMSAVGRGLISSSSLIFSTLLTFIYTFLILYYRRSLRNFVVYQFEKRVRSEIRSTLSKVREIVQSYVGGLGIVIIVLSVANSIGLYIIGVQYAIFWGALAGLLAVIPYVGTALGGILPFLFCLATADHNWQPIAVLVYYGTIQTLEGNILTPKIVGDKVNINPLIAIIAIVIFGAIWGIGGIVLALPLISIIRIILSQFEETESIAVLMSSKIAGESHVFKKIADHA